MAGKGTAGFGTAGLGTAGLGTAGLGTTGVAPGCWGLPVAVALPIAGMLVMDRPPDVGMLGIGLERLGVVVGGARGVVGIWVPGIGVVEPGVVEPGVVGLV